MCGGANRRGSLSPSPGTDLFLPDDLNRHSSQPRSKIRILLKYRADVQQQ